jgi:hypothetical protein
LGLGVVLIGAGSPALGQIETVSPTRNFEGATITFDDLTPGVTLVPGDAIAPGVRFGGSGAAASERALVVDTGGGNLALQTIEITAGTPSFIAFEFDSDLDAFGATVTQVVNGNGNPAARAFDAALTDLLPFGWEPATTFFMGHRNASATPIRAYRYSISQTPTTEVIQIDNLVLSYVATNFDDFNTALFDQFESKGKFQVTLIAAFGGTTIDTPVLTDSATLVLRSVAHRDGDTADSGATVGDGTSGDANDTGARTVADADLSWVPLDISGAKVTGVTRQVHTELLSLNLTGSGWSVRAGLSQAPDQSISPGEVVSQDTTGNPASDFPADSYFNVFFEIDTPAAYGSMTLINKIPFVVRTTINEFPPFGGAYVHDFEPALTFAIPLYMKSSPSTLVGYLRKGVHVVESAQNPPTDEEVEEHFEEIVQVPLPPECGECGNLGFAVVPFMFGGLYFMRRRVRRFGA